MALPSSGVICMYDVNIELGNSGTAQICLNDTAVRDLFGVSSGAICLSDGYGASAVQAGLYSSVSGGIPADTYALPNPSTSTVPQGNNPILHGPVLAMAEMSDLGTHPFGTAGYGTPAFPTAQLPTFTDQNYPLNQIAAPRVPQLPGMMNSHFALENAGGAIKLFSDGNLYYFLGDTSGVTQRYSEPLIPTAQAASWSTAATYATWHRSHQGYSFSPQLPDNNAWPAPVVYNNTAIGSGWGQAVPSPGGGVDAISLGVMISKTFLPGGVDSSYNIMGWTRYIVSNMTGEGLWSETVAEPNGNQQFVQKTIKYGQVNYVAPSYGTPGWAQTQYYAVGTYQNKLWYITSQQRQTPSTTADRYQINAPQMDSLKSTSITQIEQILPIFSAINSQPWNAPSPAGPQTFGFHRARQYYYHQDGVSAEPFAPYAHPYYTFGSPNFARGGPQSMSNPAGWIHGADQPGPTHSTAMRANHQQTGAVTHDWFQYTINPGF
jgi:hypothetical protein